MPKFRNKFPKELLEELPKELPNDFLKTTGGVSEIPKEIVWEIVKRISEWILARIPKKSTEVNSKQI